MTRIPFILLSASDGSPLTGASPTVTISKDGGTFAAATNAPAEIGNGYYYIDLTATETTVTYNVVIRATATGAQPTAIVWEPEQTMPTVPTASDNAQAVWGAQTKEVTIATVQADTFATASALTTVGNNVSAVKAKTDNLPQSPAAVTDVTTAQADIIAAMPDISGLSTFDASEDVVNISISSANAIRDGLSTFDPTTDAVTIDATQAASMATADVSELATSSELANTQEDIISAMPTTDITAIKAGLYNWELVKDGSTESLTAKSGSSTVAQSTITRNSAGEIVKMEESE